MFAGVRTALLSAVPVAAVVGIDTTEEWLVDPGFDNAAVWDSLGGGNVNSTFPSELYVHDASNPNTYQATNGLIRIPPDGTYRLTLPAPDHVVALPSSPTLVQFGKGALTNVSGSISLATLTSGGTFTFAVTGCTTKRFGFKFQGGSNNFAWPGLSLNRIA